MADPTPNATECLQRINAGDEAAVNELLQLVYDELRAMAGHFMQAERRDHTLQPTALVHEAYMRLIEQDVDWKDRAHFLAIGAQAIRRVLIDHGRRQKAQKRGGDAQRVTLDESVAFAGSREVDVLALDEALDRLTELNPRQSRVVELRFFGGLTGPQVAEVLGVSRTTVADDWAVARAWLSRELSRE